MPKIKTNSGVKKRFRVTRTGKVMKNNANANHILTKKNSDRKMRLRHKSTVSAADAKKIKRLLAK